MSLKHQVINKDNNLFFSPSTWKYLGTGFKITPYRIKGQLKDDNSRTKVKSQQKQDNISNILKGVLYST